MRSDGKPYTSAEQMIQPWTSRTGYQLVNLHYDVERHWLVHRLVMEAFAPVEGMEKLQVNHIDGNKQNNALSNLEWATRESNMQHAMNNGLWVPNYVAQPRERRLSDADVQEIRRLLAEKQMTQHAIAERYGVADSTISILKHGKRRFA